MLELIDIKKDYAVAGEAVHALKGVSVKFRDSEFVSILGASGCGKTTLLNIIGGLDHYTSGDLIIEGRSTKQYKDGDWDTYRNHSIGFIFQSYHLIPHQTILQNVELALMISGVSKKERRQRAIDALEKVGLKDKIHNRPNQLSGGQAQRVAIARALINDPEIVLADEPTGALDSVTSVQIMELLKEISKDRLVIMVTHNPELAEQYSTRIIRLLDGLVTDDSMPYNGEDKKDKTQPVQDETVLESAAAESGEGRKNKGKKASMSIGMAMGLSLKNLLSKRKRTAMVSVAGSIGIIGVSMVLAISAGVQGYITDMENDMLSGNPISITQSTYDFSTLMSLNGNSVSQAYIDQLKNGEKIGVTSLLKTLGTFSTGFEKSNQFTDDYLAYLSEMPEEYSNVVQYTYAFNVSNNIYTDFKVSKNLSAHFDADKFKDDYKNEYNMSVSGIRSMYSAVLSQVEDYKQWGSMISSVRTFAEAPDNFDFVMDQYDVIAVDSNGEVKTAGYSDEELKAVFKDKGSLILVLEDNCVQDLTIAQYGYFTEDEFLDYAFKGVGNADENTTLVGDDGLPYSFFIGKDSKKFTYYPNDCIYSQTSYIPEPQIPDAMIVRLAGSMGDEALKIIEVRNNYGDDGLKLLYNSDESAPLRQKLAAFAESMNFSLSTAEEFVAAFHKPTEEDKVSGYVANAYSTAYNYNGGTPLNTEDDIALPAFSEREEAYGKKVDLRVKLVLQKKDDVSYGCLESGFYYTNALTQYILDTEKDSEIVNYINDKNNADINSVPMYLDYYYVDPELDGNTVTEQGEKYFILGTATGEIEGTTSLMASLIDSVISGMGSSQKSALTAGAFGGSKTPTGVYIYPVDFNLKNKICDYLDAWNDACLHEGTITLSDGTQITGLKEGNKITYNDTVGIIINMINTMIQMITIALVAFTALSLVVSTVMIGIITYVSVVERVKEIGILRAVGARKKDIKRLFNAETFIIGLAAGIFGIIVTYLLSLIINVIVLSLAGIWGIAALPWWQAIIMIVLSVGLTLISGLIPASAAAKKDPVVALRTE